MNGLNTRAEVKGSQLKKSFPIHDARKECAKALRSGQGPYRSDLNGKVRLVQDSAAKRTIWSPYAAFTRDGIDTVRRLAEHDRMRTFGGPSKAGSRLRSQLPPCSKRSLFWKIRYGSWTSGHGSRPMCLSQRRSPFNDKVPRPSMVRDPLGNDHFPYFLFTSGVYLLSSAALLTTDTELMAIAAAATMGLSSSPKNGYSTPAAMGMPAEL